MLKGFNTVKDLLTAEEFEQYEITLYPFSIDILRTALDKKIKADPDYEVWVPFVYHKHVNMMKNKNGNLILSPYKFFLSNKGRVISGRSGTLKDVPTNNSNGYLFITFVYYKNKTESAMLHRALACNFVPVELKGHPKDLQVNHKDGVKANFGLGNLEWMTGGENNQHAIDMGLRFGVSGWNNNRTKPAKATILIGTHAGHEFIIAGQKQANENGFKMTGISSCCLGKISTYLNCSWRLATKEDILSLPEGLPSDIFKTIDFLVGTPKYKVLATVIKTGETFIIEKGAPEIKALGFLACGVSDVVTGRRKSHKGHTFMRI